VAFTATAGVPTKDFVVTMSRSADEQQGFAPADVPALTAMTPDVGSLDEEAVGEAREALEQWAKEAREALSRTKERTCDGSAGPGQTLECQTAAAYLRGVDPGVDYVARLARAADTKAAWPSAPCAP
jgi:hypothetical protein